MISFQFHDGRKQYRGSRRYNAVQAFVGFGIGSGISCAELNNFNRYYLKEVTDY